MAKKKIPRIHVKQFNYDLNMWRKAYNFIYNSVFMDYDKRKNKIMIRFESGDDVVMTYRTFIVNMIFWRPHVVFNKKITIDTLFDTATIGENTQFDKLDSIIKEFLPDNDVIQVCVVLSRIMELLAKIAEDFCLVMGNTLSLHDILQICDRHSTFDEILNTKFPDDIAISAAENYIKEKFDVALHILKNDKEGNIRPFLMAGGNINLGQLSQCIVAVGPRSDIFGNISPVVVNTNFIRGLESVSDYYVESNSAKKSLIANYSQMSDSGYTGRQFDLLTIDTTLDHSVEDCGNTNFETIVIKNGMILAMMEYKNMVTGFDKKGKPIYKQIDPDTDTHLIGNSIQFRSIINCNAPDGRICKTCYGGLHKAMGTYHSGLIASHAVSHPVSQIVLSTKHLNRTRAKIFDWGETFKKYFDIVSESIYLKKEYQNKQIEICFYYEDLEDLLSSWTETEEDKEDTLVDSVNRFNLVIDEQVIEFEYSDIDMYLNPEFVNRITSSNKSEEGLIYVNISNITHEQSIFDLNVENLEVGIYLKKIMKLFGVKTKIKHIKYMDLLHDIMDTLVDMNLPILVIHVESLLYNMIRDPFNPINRANLQVSESPYIISSIHNSILMGSLSASLGFERIVEQFKNAYTFFKKKPGKLDHFYK